MKKILLLLLLAISSFAIAQPFGYNFENCDTIDLESKPPYYIHIDTSSNNIWQRGNPNKTVFTSALSGTKALVTDTLNTYPASNTSSFIIDMFNDSAWTTDGCYSYGTIIFVHSMNTDSLAGGYIEVTIDSTNWFNVFDEGIANGFRYGIYTKYNFSNEPQPLYYLEPDTLFNGQLGFKGNITADTVYLFFEYILIAQSRDMNTPRFRFTFISDSLSQPRDGWMIDDITMGTYMGWGSVSESLSKSINLYPNPANDKMAFDFDENKFKPTELTITNIVGQRVLKVPFSKTLDISTLQQGVYYVTITDDNGNSAAKMFYKQ